MPKCTHDAISWGGGTGCSAPATRPQFNTLAHTYAGTVGSGKNKTVQLRHQPLNPHIAPLLNIINIYMSL